MTTNRYLVTFIRRNGRHRYGRAFCSYAMACAWAAQHLAGDVAATIEPIRETIGRGA